MLLLLNSYYGAMKKTLKLNRFLAKFELQDIKFTSPPYSRIYFLKCETTKIYDIDLRLR